MIKEIEDSIMKTSQRKFRKLRIWKKIKLQKSYFHDGQTVLLDYLSNDLEPRMIRGKGPYYKELVIKHELYYICGVILVSNSRCFKLS